MYLAFAFFKSSSETNSVLILFNSLKTSTTALSVTAFLTDEPERNLLMYFPEPIEEYAPYVQPCFSRKFKNNLPSPPPPKIWFANKAANILYQSFLNLTSLPMQFQIVRHLACQ